VASWVVEAGQSRLWQWHPGSHLQVQQQAVPRVHPHVRD